MALPGSIITLTTDFGVIDWYVACMKGIILGLDPHATIVDVTHEIPPGDVRAGAITLGAFYPHFPPHSIHVVVVDPGVGSARAALAIETDRCFFVGPDNGVLSLALDHEKIKTIRHLTNPRFHLPPVCSTFHGRDIFAPAAAHLSRGGAPAELGPESPDYHKLDWPQPVIEDRQIRGELVYIDRFGNGITNISSQALARWGSAVLAVAIPGRFQARLESFYQAVEPGQPLALIGSTRHLEIAINQGSAAKQLALAIGAPVIVTPQ